jgi:hypothetical protein
MKRAAAHRHRRAAFVAVRRIVMIEHETREMIHLAAWKAMRQAAEEFYPPRDPRPHDVLHRLQEGLQLPFCHGSGHAGAI